MSEVDPLLSRLAELVRDEPKEDPRWEAFTRGDVSDADRAELEAFAAEAEAYRPLDAAARDRMTDAVMARLGAGSSPNPSSGAAARLVDGPREGARDAPPARSVVRPFRRARGLGWGALGVTAVAAAALLFVVRGHGAPALPAYAMVVEGGDKSERGDVKTADVVKLGKTSLLTINLRPATRVDEAVAARAFLVRAGKVTLLEAPIEVAEGGAIRVSGSRQALFGATPAGRYEIAIAVASSGALPSVADVERDLADASRDGSSPSAYKLVHYRVELKPED